MFKKYLEYLKNNPNKYWFKAKLYGWGWVPVRWQGWAAILIFVVLIICSGLSLDKKPEPSATDLAWFFLRIAVTVAILMIVCYKTGEKPRWQWGLPKKDKKVL